VRGSRRPPRTLVAVLTADVVSTLGSEMTAVALPWFVLVTTGSAARMAGVMAAEFAGIALLGLPAGRFAHLLGPRQALMVADGVRAPLVALIPALYWAGLLHYAVLLLIGLVVGGCFPAYASGQRVLLAGVTGDDDVRLTRAGALLGGVNETASFIGPAVGGGLIAWVGAPSVLVIDAVTYVVSFALVAALVPSAPQVPDDEPTTSLTGLRYLRADRALRRQLVAVMVAGIGWTALMATLPVAARRRYHGGGQLAGALVAAYGGGSVLGAVAAARTKRVVGRPGLPLVAIAVAMAVAVVRLPSWGLAVAVAVFGVGNGIFFPRLFTALTLRPPPRLRTPVMATAQVAMSVTSPVGFVAGGLLLEHASISAAFVLVAATATVAAVVSVTGQPLSTGVEVERGSSDEADQGEPGLLGELHRE